MKKSLIVSLPLVWVTGFNTLVARAAGTDGTSFFGQQNVRWDVVWAEERGDAAIQILVGRVIAFLYIVAVLYGLWGGFNILTAGGDEEKVKKGKTIIIQALIGLVVIFLASSIVQWLIESVLIGT